MYKDKLQNYQYDCPMHLGRCKKFSQYITEFAKERTGDGLDVGAGPGGPNGKFFTKCQTLQGCDSEIEVVNSFSEKYTHKFQYFLGSDVPLPYGDQCKDFVVCSCVIQHLKSIEELEKGISQMSRVLKKGGDFYLMFKAGTNDSNLTHLNKHYMEQRTFRVFEPSNVQELCKKYQLQLQSSENALDNNWIPYNCSIFKKKA